jgi:hypothetical protein
MIDVEFVIPICLQGKYIDRINNFLKYGLINANNHSILVTLLVDCNEEHLAKKLITNHNIKIVSCPLPHEACKVYHYFSNYNKENLKTTRWIAKIDDDSINDVDLLIKNLDLEYNYEKEYYLIAGLQQDLDSVEYDILNELGYSHWFHYNNVLGNYIIHEKEASVISSQALKTILNNADALELMTKRSFVEFGYTDQCLAAAARICKIYPSSPLFLTPEPQLHNFSLFGGKVAHIHFIAEDIDQVIFNILKNKIDNKLLNTKFTGINYKLKNNYEEVNNIICFKNDQTIHSLYDYCYWKFWSLDKNNITMHSIDGMPNIILNIDTLKGNLNTVLRPV